MLVLLAPGADADKARAGILRVLDGVEGVVLTQESPSVFRLDGDSSRIAIDRLQLVTGVERVFRLEPRHPKIGPRPGRRGFEHRGLWFGDGELHVFAGLCAVDTRANVEAVMAALGREGLVTARMGAYKPRTSPYDFQGLGKECLPWVFESAARHGVRVIAMEITDARQIEEIDRALDATHDRTGVLLQIGTRSAQSFELLKAAGRQTRHPVLYKRGLSLGLEESFSACEYIAEAGNDRIVYCLRGVRSELSGPHRNLVDFAHAPVVRQKTRLPVCVDPSHAVGRLEWDERGLSDVHHATGQGLLAGASLVLVDLHPDRKEAVCDGAQALSLEALPGFVAYAKSVFAFAAQLSSGSGRPS